VCCAVLCCAVSEIDGWFLKAAGKIGEDKRTWCVCVACCGGSVAGCCPAGTRDVMRLLERPRLERKGNSRGQSHGKVRAAEEYCNGLVLLERWRR
jgi:hypothetical protein